MKNNRQNTSWIDHKFYIKNRVLTTKILSLKIEEFNENVLKQMKTNTIIALQFKILTSTGLYRSITDVKPYLSTQIKKITNIFTNT